MFSPSTFASENLFSLDGFGPFRVSSLILHTLRRNLVLTRGIPPHFRDGV